MVALLAVGSAEADAARGLAIINTGEDIVEVGTISDALRAEVEAETKPGVAIGVMYSRFGLFWLDIWRWDKKYVVFGGEEFWEVSEAQAKELAGASLSKPLTLTVPPGLMVLLVLAIAFIGFLVWSSRQPDAAEPGADPDSDES